MKKILLQQDSNFNFRKSKIYSILIVTILLTTVLISQGMGIIKAKEQQKKSQSKQLKEKQPRVTMTLFETDLREALNEISLQTGVNIIPDQTVNGVVTADLKNVPLGKALRMVLVGGGYTFRKIEDFYLVGLPDPKSNTFSKLSEVNIVRLDYINANHRF